MPHNPSIPVETSIALKSTGARLKSALNHNHDPLSRNGDGRWSSSKSGTAEGSGW